jgi:hypothetical protein
MKIINIVLPFIRFFHANAFWNFKKLRKFRNTVKIEENVTSSNGYCAILFVPDERIHLYIKLSGIGNGRIAEKSTEELIKYFEKYSRKFNMLIDMTDAISARHMAISNIVSFGRYYYDFFGKIAIVVSNAYLLKYVRIFDFATNERFHIKTFADENQAKLWLKSK